MVILARLGAAVVLLAPPLLSAWLASSLAVALGGPGWLAAASGLLVFPVLPAVWEVGAVRRRDRARRPRRVALHTTLAVRTWTVALAFVGLLLAWWPSASFLALARNGDWFLDPAAPRQQLVGRGLKVLAGGLESLWLSTRDDPYRRWRLDPPALPPGERPRPAPEAALRPSPPPLEADAAPAARADAAPGPRADAAPGARADAAPGPRADAAPGARADAAPGPRADAAPGARAAAPTSPDQPHPPLCARLEDGTQVCVAYEAPPAPRPAPGRAPPVEVPEARDRSAEPPAAAHHLHPVVESLAPAQEQSLDAVAQALKQGTLPGADRVKAVHDWVADRIAYDADAYRTMQLPPQDAEAVFARRTAVCAGYARLAAELGQRVGESIVYLTGYAMGPRGVEGHAWNAARIDRGWALLDITWDSGVLVPGPVLRFQKAYSGRFLFMRPEDFARSHLPDDESWQLLDRPVDATDFVKALPLSPTAARLGIGVLEPTRAYLETSQRQLEVVLDNPSRHPVGVRLVRDGAAPVRCEPQPGDARFRCALEFPALWQLQLYAAEGGHLVALAQGLVRTR